MDYYITYSHQYNITMQYYKWINNKDNSFIGSKIEEHENKSYQNKDNNISIVGQDVPITSVDSSKIINANDLEGNSIDDTKGLSVTNSGFDDGSAFGGGLPFSGYSPLQGNHNKCPDENFCKGIKNVLSCPPKNSTGRNGDWASSNVRNFLTVNKGVLVPPRRKQMCFRININNFPELKKTEGKFENFIYSSAGSEAKQLIKLYGNNTEKAHQAIRYSFADIGNIIRGDDMMDTPTSKETITYLEKVLKIYNENNDKPKDAKKWWTENRHHVWEAMMCGYQSAQKDNQCTGYGNIDDIPQYLRWFREWGTYVCSEYKNKFEDVIKLCNIQQFTNQDDSQL
ncbi:erythrocyte membrane protein 1 [Plasmodium falciparum RAJ116]|uniref:Erythrocyte membrane protein 1 n=1 Tax=Plasmodium falciparum RAJ116 TaxID=580058 RepID=A0A0L0CUV6_PLAFA|nr:erythrocyte membrane protein 1 [Plasmodium falciparum RAJ116]